MCILFWTLDNHSVYKFIFAANRDEYLNRPTSLASWWHPNILSGLDLQRPERGTWLGINRTGRFAAVTNFRESQTVNEKLLSRGAVVRDILESDLELEQRFRIINSRASKYGGFNLISADLSLKHPRMLYLSNRKIDNIQNLNSRNFYGLSNSLLENPWPKVKMGIPKFKSIVEDVDSEEKIVERLLETLSIIVPFGPTTATDPYHLEDLTKTIRVPKFDFDGDYATRTSTVILVSHENEVVFVEKTLFTEECRWFRFNISEAQLVQKCGPQSVSW